MALVTQQMIRAHPDLSIILNPWDQLEVLVRNTNSLLASYKAVNGTLQVNVKVSHKETLTGEILAYNYEVVICYYARDETREYVSRDLTITYSLSIKDYMSVHDTYRLWDDSLMVDPV